MIIYYSATGNSKWIANQIAKGTSDTAKSLTTLARQGVTPESLVIKDKIGIVFPVYAWRAPKVVVDYIKRLNIPEGVYKYAIATCGGQAGKTMKYLNKDFPTDAAWSLLMPDNYIRMWDVNPKEEMLKKINASKEKLPKIIDAINNKQHIVDVEEGGWIAPILSGIVNWGFVTFLNSAKGYRTDDTCTGCGVCTTQCIFNNIYLDENNRPVWGDKCNQCGACIHNCPVACIQYKNKTQKRGRYNLYRDYKGDK